MNSLREGGQAYCHAMTLPLFLTRAALLSSVSLAYNLRVLALKKGSENTTCAQWYDKSYAQDSLRTHSFFMAKFFLN